MTFPDPEWRPTSDDYFRACAPDGSRLHGSSDVKLFDRSPRIYAERLYAPLVLQASGTRTKLQRKAMDAAQQWGLASKNGDSDLLRRWAEGVVEDAKAKPYMDFGTAIEARLFPASGEPVPKLASKALDDAAEVRAWRIGQHLEAGRFFKAEGAAHQVAHFWQDPDSGLWLRMRLDCCYHSNAGPATFDLKIWSRLNTKYLRKSVMDNGADTQCAIYRRGELDLWGHKNAWQLVIAGPGVSDLILVRPLGASLIQAADDRLSFTLDRLARAYQTGDFSAPEERPTEI